MFLAVLQVSHRFTFASSGVLGTLACGGKVVLSAPNDAAAAMSLIERERVTHCALTPALARQWLLARAASSGPDLSSLQVLQVGGARLDESTAVQLNRAFDCRIQQVYGVSEKLLNFTRLDDPPEVAFTTQERPPSPGDEILVVDGAGRPVADDEMGELLARGPGVITEYHGGAAATSFTPDGHYRTGDLVRRHESGNLVVAGRVKDVINRGGEKIPADELEALVLEHPGVRPPQPSLRPIVYWVRPCACTSWAVTREHRPCRNSGGIWRTADRPGSSCPNGSPRFRRSP